MKRDAGHISGNMSVVWSQKWQYERDVVPDVAMGSVTRGTEVAI